MGIYFLPVDLVEKHIQIATLKWEKSMGQGVFASPDLAAFELGVSPGMEATIDSPGSMVGSWGESLP